MVGESQDRGDKQNLILYYHNKNYTLEVSQVKIVLRTSHVSRRDRSTVDHIICGSGGKGMKGEKDKK